MVKQLKKLLYDKKLKDSPNGAIAVWKINPWKVFFAFILSAVSLIILYGIFFTSGEEGTSNFFGNAIFYAVVILITIGIFYILASTALKFRKLITGFFIGFILIMTVYWTLGQIFGHYDILSFHQGGTSLWILITILAGLGAKRIDGNLDRHDVGYGFLVLIVVIGANIPVANSQGFLWNVDNLLATVTNFVSLPF